MSFHQNESALTLLTEKMKELLPQSIHRNIFISGLIFLSLGLLFSGPVMSMSIMLLGANWFAEGNYRKRLNLFCHTKPALLVSAVFFFHVLGLLWSSDWHYGWDDVRTKIPLFVIPFILSTSPVLSKNHFHLLLAFFVAGVLVSSLISVSVLLGVIPIEIHDIRDISIFVSHIRLSLMICLAISILGFFIAQNNSTSIRALLSLAIAWLIIFMAILESLTGLIILFVVYAVVGIYYFNSRKSYWGKIVLVGAATLLIGTGVKVYSIARSFIQVKPIDSALLEKRTLAGNPYKNDADILIVENGTYANIQMCLPELAEGWKKKSLFPFDGRDVKGNLLSQTLVRYMASMGLERKDAQSFSKLSSNDIKYVENGVTNYKYPNMGSLNARIYETIWEIDVYCKGSNPSGNSLTMRFEFWKAGWHIFKNHVMTGIGTGDVKNGFAAQYKLDHSILDERWRLRGHNQYLTISIALGIPGLILFLLSLIYPLFHRQMYRNYFYAVFWLIAVLSFITEDTLETQAGATFFALFNSVFLFSQPESELSKAGLSPKSVS